MLKFLFKNVKLFLLMIVIALSSCVKNPLDVDPKVPVVPPIDGIPDDFDFATVRSINVSVTIDDRFEGKYFYSVEIYDANPLSADAAKLLAKGVAKGAFPFEQELTVPKITEKVYVKQIDPLRRESVKVCLLPSDTKSVSCLFSSQAKATKSAVGNDLRAVSTRSAADYPLPSEYTTIAQSNFQDWKANGNFYVAKGSDLTFDSAPWQQNVSLYVAGTVTLDKWDLPAGNKIVVLPEGKVYVKNINAISQAGNMLIVHKGGLLDLVEKGDGKVQLDNSASIMNDGEFVAKDLTVTGNARVTNNDEMKIGEEKGNGKIALESAGSYFENNGHCVTDAFSTSTSATLINTCSIEILKTMDCEGSKIQLEDGSLLVCEDLVANNIKATMSGSAVWSITKSATFESNNTITGAIENSASPTVMIDKFGGGNSGNKKNITFAGVMNLISLSKFLSEKYYTMESGVTLSETPINPVMPTDCNGGGIPEDPGVPEGPSDPDFPIEVPTSEAYMFIMEDGWPNVEKCDYDMNDLVLLIKEPTYRADANNKVSSVVYNIDLKAVGATRKLGAGVQFDNIPASKIKSVFVGVRDPFKVSDYFAPGGNGAEGVQRAVIPFFDNAHAILGAEDGKITNTHKASEAKPICGFLCEITFTEPVSIADVSPAKANFFIVNGGNAEKRTEVHLAGRVSTEKCKEDPLQYKTADNLMWGCMIPDSNFRYPQESKKINDAYPDFVNWCLSGGRSNADWYMNPVSDLVY